MNIYERLKKDHRIQKNLAVAIMQTSGDSPDRRQLFAQFKTEVESHAAAEEQVFYASLIKKPDGQDQARHGIAEHKTAADLIEELTELGMDSGGWIHKFEKLKHELLHHLEEEEKEVFPLAQSLLNSSEEQAMTSEFNRRKEAEQ